jgi:zinc transport system substrate-binding protein
LHSTHPTKKDYSPVRSIWTGIAVLGLVVALLAAGGCHRAVDDPMSGKLTVAVSILPQAWLVEQVGGDRVAVVTMVRPGESAEMSQPTDAQVSQVMRAAAYFRIGMPFENSRGFSAIESSGKPKVVDMRRGIKLREMPHHIHPGEDESPREQHAATGHDLGEGKDPHIWLSPRLLKIEARTVADTLAEMDPPHRAEYERNLAELESRLDKLDRTLHEKLDPFRGRAFLVFHPAWGYFADDYGLREMAIEMEGKEPTDHELTELQHHAKAEGVKVIFSQPQSGRRSTIAVAKAIGGRVEVLDDLAPDVAAGLVKTADALVGSFQ